MARNVTVACVSGAPLVIDPELEVGRAVDVMIAHWRDRVATVLPDRPDLIVLPEQCDRPKGSLEWQLAFLQRRGDAVREFFADLARRHRTYVAYSGYRSAPDGRAYNSTQFLGRDGSVVGTYNKNFLTIRGHQKGLTFGAEFPVFELDFGRVAAIICFDLNFEELRARCEAADPDLIVFSSAYHGGLMQAYWAYTCGAYLASAVYPPAPSGIVSPLGEVVATTTNYQHEIVATVNLDCEVLHLDYNKKSFQSLKERHGRDVKIHDPGRLGSCLISAESDDLRIEEVIKEFDLELLGDYFNRVRAYRQAHLPPQYPTEAA